MEHFSNWDVDSGWEVVVEGRVANMWTWCPRWTVGATTSWWRSIGTWWRRDVVVTGGRTRWDGDVVVTSRRDHPTGVGWSLRDVTVVTLRGRRAGRRSWDGTPRGYLQLRIDPEV